MLEEKRYPDSSPSATFVEGGRGKIITKNLKGQGMRNT